MSFYQAATEKMYDVLGPLHEADAAAFYASGDEEVDESTLPPPPLLPKMIPLRRALVMFDYAMRVVHMGVFALALGWRYFVIQRMKEPPPTCGTLLNFFTVP
jgi:hypothetical protein